MWFVVQMTTGSASLANDGDDSVSGTTSYTACTQILVVGEALLYACNC